MPSKKKPGPKTHTPTDEQRARVRMAASLGIGHDAVANIIGICRRSLQKYYKEELQASKDEMNFRVMETTYAKCLDPSPANNALRMFWLKTRAQWRETDQLDPEKARLAALEMLRPMSLQEWEQMDPDQMNGGAPRPVNGNGNGHA